MTSPLGQTQLKPGDLLLYSPMPLSAGSLSGWVSGKVISIKTWTRVAHCEIYAGDGMSQASRDGIGVNTYPLRLAQLCCVRRPIGMTPEQWEAGNEWFNKVARGQKYDFLGLLCFTLAVKRGSPDRMFCSEYGARRYRMSSFDPVNPDMDADCVAPATLWQSATFYKVWERGGE